MMVTMKRVAKAAIIPLTLAGLVVIAWWLVHDAKFDVLDPSGDIALQQRRILFFTLSLAAVVVIPVFTMLVTFAWRFRESRKDPSYAPEWQDNKWLEMIWWGIPVAIIATLGTVTWITTHQLDPYKAIESDVETIEVQVVALQWKWLFIYPEQGVATVNHLPIPVGAPVHFTLTADAPMSAFWVPSLGSQIYAMNGMTSQLNLIADKAGMYEGYNTNINGEGYSSMRFTVEAMSPSRFGEWVQQRYGADPLDATAYAQLAQPGVQQQKLRFRTVNTELFDEIVAKYMHHGHSESSTNTSGTHEGEKGHEHMHGGAH